MSQWDEGYPAGVEYIKLAKSELSPAHLNFCLALSGRETVDLGGSFTYAELGSGFGLSTVGWAAQYPQGRFHCIDYNPAQTDWTRQLVRDLGLANLTVHTASVREMLGRAAGRDMPRCDFIVLHGLYSWVSEEVRADIRLFLERYLDDGGHAYVSYNCMPGNKDADAMRRLMHESLAHMRDMRHHRMLDESLALLRELRSCGAAFFADSPGAGALLDRWGEVDHDYLVGELMPKEHRSFYFSEIHEAMSGAGLVWAGSAGVRHYLEPMAATGRMRALFAERGQDPVFRETLKDFCFSTAFRQDLFASPKDGLCGRSAASVLKEMRFCLVEGRDMRPRPGASSVPSLPRIALDEALNRRIQAALAEAPATLSDIARATGLPEDAALEAVTVLVALGVVCPSLGHGGPGVRKTVKRLNLRLLRDVPDGGRAALLSANGGWITDWEALPYAYQAARLMGGDMAGRMRRELQAQERMTDGMDWSGNGKDALRETIDAYIRDNGDQMEAFARRHGWL